MEHREENQILLHEELCIDNSSQERRAELTKRFHDNINLAYSVANKYKRTIENSKSLTMEDAYQLALLGLWEACLNFKEDLGFKFATYAVPTIQGRILRFWRDKDSVLKLPRWFTDIRSAIYRHGFSTPLSEYEINIIVAEGKVSREQILEYQDIVISSLDATVCDNENDHDHYSLLADENSTIEDKFFEDELQYTVDLLLRYINPAHRDFIEEWIYSVLEGTPAGQVELAKKYGVAQPTVSREIRKAIASFKEHRDEVLELFGR